MISMINKKVFRNYFKAMGFIFPLPKILLNPNNLHIIAFKVIKCFFGAPIC